MLNETLYQCARCIANSLNEIPTLRSMCDACLNDAIPKYMQGFTCMRIYCEKKITLDNERVKLLCPTK